MLSFILNDITIHIELSTGMTVLDFVRHHKHLTGTKIGCREGDCGACTLLVGSLENDNIEYRSVTSCLMPLANAEGKHIVTIEGINPPAGQLTPVQQVMVEENGTQCGFCTAGFVVSLTGYCLNHNDISSQSIISSIDGNICRCTGYKSIERASSRLVDLLNTKDGLTPLSFAIANNIVPAWFANIPQRLADLGATTPDVESFDKNQFVGGGTDLYVQRPEEMLHQSSAPLLNNHELKGIYENQGRIEIGASTTVTDVMESAIMNNLFPDLKKHLKLVSSTPIRNMATLAGNIVNASPIGDLTIFLLALNATVVVKAGETREIPLRDFYQGYKKLSKSADEVVVKIHFPIPASHAKFNFEKVSKRTYLDIATVNTAMLISRENDLITEAHVSAGGVGPVPLYLKNVSSFLLLKQYPFDDETMHELMHILDTEISPISDVRGSSEYKRLLMKQLFQAHFTEIFTSI